MGQRVKHGGARDFEHWQDRVNSAVTTFPGFLATEVTPPVGESREWSIVYRFDCVEHLEAWLGSTVRNRLLDEGADLFEAPASQQVLVGERDEQLVTVVISHPVMPEHEQQFLDWQDQVTAAERKFTGFRGSQLFRPVPGVQQDWTVVYRFASEADLNRWLESPERAELLVQEELFKDYQLNTVANSFGSWFSFGGDAEIAVSTPAWKSALSVLVGLYPTIVLLTLAISKLWPNAELWASLLVGNVLSVGLLTWVVMPIVTRALRFWLVEAPTRSHARVDRIGALMSIGFLTVAALVFWLATTQIWTLP
jgi:antibiotic biosynthesis monooxygenase (ABM) superfamily enzyme